MTLNEAVFSRKSIRSYTGEAITAAELDKILKAANAAPVGMGQFQNYHITVINNRKLLDEIEAVTIKAFGNGNPHPLYGAPTLVLISAEKPDLARSNSVHSSAAMIVHNMALTAVELGVGACCIWGAIAALKSSPETVTKLCLPVGYEPCCALALGKTDEKYTLRDLSDRIAKSTID